MPRECIVAAALHELVEFSEVERSQRRAARHNVHVYMHNYTRGGACIAANCNGDMLQRSQTRNLKCYCGRISGVFCGIFNQKAGWLVSMPEPLALDAT